MKKEPKEEKAKCTGCNDRPFIRIYYATRTHKQVAQVIKEFRRLPYGAEGRLK